MYKVSGPYYSCPSPYGKPSKSMEHYTYWVQCEGKSGSVEIINFVQRGDYYVKNFYSPGQRGKYYKRLGNAVNQAKRQLENGQ